MSESTEIRMACHHGWLVLSDERVSLVHRRSLRRKPLWTVQRAAVAGASLRREPEGYTVSVRTRAGKELPVVRLHPADALRVVKLLGYAPALLSPALDTPAQRDSVSRVRCKGGRIEVSRDAIAFVPGLIRLGRVTPWRLKRDRISGVACLRLPGTRLLHDLELHTMDGRTLRVRKVRPEAALRLLHLIGYVPGTLPQQPVMQREALETHFFTGEADEAPEKITPATKTRSNRARRQAVLRDLDELWAQQRSASMA